MAKKLKIEIKHLSLKDLERFLMKKTGKNLYKNCNILNLVIIEQNLNC